MVEEGLMRIQGIRHSHDFTCLHSAGFFLAHRVQVPPYFGWSLPGGQRTSDSDGPGPLLRLLKIYKGGIVLELLGKDLDLLDPTTPSYPKRTPHLCRHRHVKPNVPNVRNPSLLFNQPITEVVALCSTFPNLGQFLATVQRHSPNARAAATCRPCAQVSEV